MSVYTVGASETISFTLEASIVQVIPLFAEDTIQFEEFAFPLGDFEIVRFGLEADAPVHFRPIEGEVIEFQDEATVKRIVRASATEALIVYTVVPDVGPPPSFHIDETGVTMTAVASREFSIQAHETLHFVLHASGPIKKPDGIEVSGSETIAFDLSSPQPVPATAVEHISFTLSASVQLSNTNVEDTLEFLDVASCRVIRKIIASENVEFKTSFTFLILDGCVEKVYSPFIGDGELEAPPEELPEVSGDEGFLLQYPATSPTSEVRLRSPNFGNVHRVSLDRINRETRGGKLIVFADPIWSKAENLLFVFSALSRDQVSDLKAFYRTALGKRIRLVDHENCAWRGVIVQPNDPFVQDGPGCQHTASFEFRGERE